VNDNENELREAAKCKSTRSLITLRAICQRYIDENPIHPESDDVRKNIMIIDDELRNRQDFML
jgi:hypothetical protein